jgi:hypothetical protein
MRQIEAFAVPAFIVSIGNCEVVPSIERTLPGKNHSPTVAGTSTLQMSDPDGVQVNLTANCRKLRRLRLVPARVGEAARLRPFASGGDLRQVVSEDDAIGEVLELQLPESLEVAPRPVAHTGS